MTIALDILAGMLIGTLMGLIASAHAAILLTYRPPRYFQRRIEDGGSPNIVTTFVFGLVVLWVIAGVLAALFADALIDQNATLEIVPSSEYLVTIITVLVLFGTIAIFFMRDRWLHTAINLATAIALYGILIPNAVIALQNRT